MEEPAMSDEQFNATLERRITAALADEIASADLAMLISETEVAISDAEATADLERSKALDPALSPDATAAREAMQAAEFARDRLHTVLPRLKDRHKQIAAQEDRTEWRAHYETLKVERDALAAELRELYPEFETKIIDLLARIAENDEKLSRLHRARPPGVALHLRGAELEARSLGGFTRSDPSISTTLKLPTFGPGERLAWPPPQPVSFAPVLPGGDPRLFTNRWYEPKQEQAQAAAERMAREEKEREAKALANYHGPRWWERA
jgi:hypothetical protein